MFVIDTNVLVYAANENANEHKACRHLVEKSRASNLPWYATWPVIYEFLRVITHLRVLKNPWSITEAWKYIEALLASPGLTMLQQTARHQQIAGDIMKRYATLSGNIVHDLHTAILMKEHGIKNIYTFDQDFNRFEFVEVLEPTNVLD